MEIAKEKKERGKGKCLNKDADGKRYTENKKEKKKNNDKIRINMEGDRGREGGTQKK